jgi:hypothetical protein
MKIKNLLIPAVAAALLASLAPLHAGGPIKPRTPPPKPVPDTVAEVSTTSITVRHVKFTKPKDPAGDYTQAASTKSYKVNAFTTVTIDNVPAKLTDLKAGMVVFIAADAPSATDPNALDGTAVQIRGQTKK